MEERYKVEESASVCGSHAVYDRVDKRLICICTTETDAKYMADLLNEDEEYNITSE